MEKLSNSTTKLLYVFKSAAWITIDLEESEIY